MSGPVPVENIQDAAAPRPRDLPGFELVPLARNHLVVDSVALEVHGEPPTFEQWSRGADHLKKIHGAVRFWLGDLINLGESLFLEEASQVIDQSFLSEKEVKDYSYVAKLVKPTVRAAAQSWEHCHAVARAGIQAPEKQREWLERSRGEDWTARKLATEIAMATLDGKTFMKWFLVVDTPSEAKRDKLAEQLQADGWTVSKKEAVKKAPKAKKAKKEVTARAKKAPKASTRRRRT